MKLVFEDYKGDRFKKAKLKNKYPGITIVNFFFFHYDQSKPYMIWLVMMKANNPSLTLQ